jgi:hypothetical protein
MRAGRRRCRTAAAGCTAAKSTGPRTAEGLERIRQARTTHGRYSAQMMELRREMAAWRRLARTAIQALE